MQVFILVKVDFGHKENIGVFSSWDKARGYQSSLELNLFDSGSLCGISFYIEESFIK